MTVPEENRPKSPKAEEATPDSPPDTDQETPQASSRTMGEAMEEAGITPEDYEQ
ncbi:hypothetical protein WDH52_12710 [Streptomyces sp. TRM70308]|uniref:hypothetical protein n=1 Tax=Streptomyces TaxID=1883 RepID=UPI0022489C23|nr:hypothetical protein [Streptomyces sp. JHD 1]MCX2968159.1 hypothetical protein [Streptomyces sp. JHD 1]